MLSKRRLRDANGPDRQYFYCTCSRLLYDTPAHRALFSVFVHTQLLCPCLKYVLRAPECSHRSSHVCSTLLPTRRHSPPSRDLVHAGVLQVQRVAARVGTSGCFGSAGHSCTYWFGFTRRARGWCLRRGVRAPRRARAHAAPATGTHTSGGEKMGVCGESGKRGTRWSLEQAMNFARRGAAGPARGRRAPSSALCASGLLLASSSSSKRRTSLALVAGPRGRVATRVLGWLTQHTPNA